MADFDSMLPPRWEYRIVVHDCNLYEDVKRPAKDLLNELNSLGADGWELVAAVPIVQEDVTKEIRYVFKRRDE